MAHPIYKVKVDLDRLEKSLRLVLRQIENGSIIRVPSVTTVINKRKEADGMIYAAWKLGTEGKDYKVEWGDKANSGTLAHALIHKEPVNDALYSPEMMAQAMLAVDNYQKWTYQSRLESECHEVSLVCPCHLMGGTIDDVWIQDGVRSIGDIKTGKLWPDHLIQCAAYKHLWDTNYPDKPITGGFHLLHFDKETADFGHAHFSDLADAWEAFVHLRAVYAVMETLKERV